MFKNNDKEKIVGTFMGNGYDVKVEENTVIFLKKGQKPFLFDLETQSDFAGRMVALNILNVTEVCRDKSIGTKILSKDCSSSEIVGIIYDSMVENFDSKNLGALKDSTSELNELVKSETLTGDTLEIISNVVNLNNDLIEKFTPAAESVEEISEEVVVQTAEVEGMTC